MGEPRKKYDKRKCHHAENVEESGLSPIVIVKLILVASFCRLVEFRVMFLIFTLSFSCAIRRF